MARAGATLSSFANGPKLMAALVSAGSVSKIKIVKLSVRNLI